MEHSVSGRNAGWLAWTVALTLGVLACASQPAGAMCRNGLFVNPDQLQQARLRMNDPGWLEEADRLRRRATAFADLVARPYGGESPRKFLDAGRRDLMPAMDLALYAVISEAPDRRAAGTKAAEILLAWAKGTARPGQFSRRAPDPGVRDEDYGGLGLFVSLVAIGATHTYHLLRCSGFLNDAEARVVSAWLNRLAQAIKEGRHRWEANGYFGGQDANNHLSWHNAAVYAVGIAIDDRSLRDWALSDPANRTNFRVMLEKAVFNGMERSSHPQDHGKPYRGEVFDRYRMVNKLGLHYAFFHILALTVMAEAAANQGEDLFRARAESGESLADALLFYGAFLTRVTCSAENPPLVERGPPGADYYLGAKVGPHYWAWLGLLARRLTDHPGVLELSARVNGTSCRPAPHPFLPLPIVPLAQ